jgi:hypothetical protein
MEAPLEIRYAGVTIGRAQEVRSAKDDVPSFFIPVRDPMPVGTVLRMRSGDHETPVRVVRAVETTDAAACGMQVRTIGEAEEVAPEFIPPPAVVAEKIKPGTPTPVVEVDLASMAEATAPELSDPAKSAVSATAADPVATPAIEIVEATPAIEIVEAAPAAKTAAPAVEAAVVAPPEPAQRSSSEVAAVPQAVPVAVGSSMTGALRSATESVPTGDASSAVSAAPSVQATASPPPTSAERPQPGNGTVAEAAPEAGGSTAEYGGQATELPPARPISGPSGRRKTKKRK